ncbi:DUF2332 domain-containing protein [Ilumatobacter sp.]|uniref:DUF2332 domain-containing protein n=1 Tax=Ilumatobacter sp. TaxID=1967498 RepID=UPI003B52212C
MRDPWDDAELVRRFRSLAETSMPRAPLNSALSTAIADDAALAGLLGHAPVGQRTPVLLLAAIHFLVLGDAHHPLAAWYPNLTESPRDPADPELAPVLRTFVGERSAAVLDLVGGRRVQTNEVGRCAVLVAAMAPIAADVGALCHVDVGTSAGLNTLLDRYAYRFDDRPPIGRSPVEIPCSTRGGGPDVDEVPRVATAVGIDSRPVDLADPDDARWLEACCWPDQADRSRRLRAAIAVAREHPPRVVRGDAVDDLGPVVAAVADAGHPVVTTTWVLSYLDPSRRIGFVGALDRIGVDIDLTWVLAESPAQTPELPHATDLGDRERTALTRVTWRDGTRRVEHLGTCHPHGYWIHWR